MKQNINLPLCASALEEYGGPEGLRKHLHVLGCGVEGIWCGENIPAEFPADLLNGYHLTFFPDWLDFYREDRAALKRKFGDLEAAWDFYGGCNPEVLLCAYRADLERAAELGAGYVVFHVSDVSIEEGYSYRWLHTHEAVIDASVEIINELLKNTAPDFDFLVENQWWPGFTFTDPALTARLLDGIAYPRKGIMLDTGHLMNCNQTIATQADGLRYIRKMLSRHGELGRMVRGIHLHQSVSGAYVRSHTGALPEEFSGNYTQRFCRSYAHIQQIDRHLPWTEPAIADLVDEIAPEYLTHELSASNRNTRHQAVSKQIDTLKRGGASFMRNQFLPADSMEKGDAENV
ncbi:MAG: TIM barrel protein [Candidatus Heteroscillospira sp.]